VRTTFVNLGAGGSVCKPDRGRAQVARVLVATVRSGRVSSFTLNIGAAGE
jgi:hypothetical protein